MAEQKTKPTQADVDAFLGRISNPQQRADALALLKLMKTVTRQQPRMWGSSLIGFGEFHYVYASGHEGDTFLIGFSPRKDALVVYFTSGLDERFREPLKRLGKTKAGKGCLYIKKLADIDLAVLREMIEASLVYLHDRIQAAQSSPSPRSAGVT